MTKLSSVLAGLAMALLSGCDVPQPASTSRSTAASGSLPAATFPDSFHAAVFRGLCDASAVAPLRDDSFVVAGDEDNALRVYSSSRPGLPIHSRDLSAFLEVDPKSPEVDIEGAARRGDQIFWISSHGRNASGKKRLTRHRLFATTIVADGTALEVQPAGKPYVNLLDDLIADPKLAPFGFAEASKRAPKSPGALNIEGLAFTPEGYLLIGFRNPIPQGKALLVTLLNPADIINGDRAKFGPPMLLDLGGLGIRSIEATLNGYLVTAGSFDGSQAGRLYQWNPAAAPKLIYDGELRDLNPEAVTVLDNGRLLLLSDDGTEQIDGKECKKLNDPAQRMFRALTADWASGPHLTRAP